MNFFKHIGKRVIDLCAEYRKTDPKLRHPVKGPLVDIFERVFIDETLRSMTKNNASNSKPEPNEPS